MARADRADTHAVAGREVILAPGAAETGAAAMTAGGLPAALPAIGVGLVGGLLVGMTGVGAGSVIAALLLVFYPDMSPHIIVGSATTQAVVMKMAGVWKRRQLQLGAGPLGVAMAAGAIPLAIAGAWTSSQIHASLMRPIIACVLALVGILLVLQAVRTNGDRRAMADEGAKGAGPSAVAPREADPPRGPVFALGALVGYVAGLTSIGTGTLFVSVLAGPLRIDAHRAVAAALIAGLLTLIVSSSTHVLLGHLDPLLAGLTAIGSVPGVIIGTALSRRMEARTLNGIIGGGIL